MDRANLDEMVDTALGFVGEHPLAAVGLAFGVGYLLSAPRAARAAGRVIGIGGRFLLASLARQAISQGGLGILAPLVQERAGEPQTGQ